MPLPTMETFLTNIARDSYIKHPEFSSLYVHKGKIGVVIGGEVYILNAITLANITARKPNNGAFTRLLAHLIKLGHAVMVECVHEERFQNMLLRVGFTELEGGLPPSYLINHELKLTKYPEYH